MNFRFNPLTLATTALVLGSTLYGATLFAQNTLTAQVSNEIREQVRRGADVASIVAKELAAGRDPQAVVSGLMAANVDRAAIASTMMAAAPDSLAIVVKALVSDTPRNNDNPNVPKSELGTQAPTAVIQAIVAAIPAERLGEAVRAVLSGTGASAGAVFALTNAVANDPRSQSVAGASSGFTAGTVLGEALKNRTDANGSQDASPESLIRAAALAAPASYADIIKAAASADPSAGMLELAIKQTIMAAPNSANNIVTFGVQTVVLQTTSHNADSLEARMNLALRGAIVAAMSNPIIKPDTRESTDVIRTAIAASSYVGNDRLVTSMTKYAANFLSSMIQTPPAGSPAESTPVEAQKAATEKYIDFLKQSSMAIAPEWAHEIAAISPKFLPPTTIAPWSPPLLGPTSPNATPGTNNPGDASTDNSDPTAGLPATGAGPSDGTPTQQSGNAGGSQGSPAGPSFSGSSGSTFSGGGGGAASRS